MPKRRVRKTKIYPNDTPPSCTCLGVVALISIAQVTDMPQSNIIIFLEELPVLVFLPLANCYLSVSFIFPSLCNGEEEKVNVLTVKQQKVFINYVGNTPFYCHLYPIFTVMLGTGCRVGEITGLTWNDVDLKNKNISINHTVGYGYVSAADNSEDKLNVKWYVNPTKTSFGNRDIPMIDVVYDVLAELYQHRKKSMFSIDGMTDFVFLNKKYTLLSLNKSIKRIVKTYNKETVRNAEKNNVSNIILTERPKVINRLKERSDFY